MQKRETLDTRWDAIRVLFAAPSRFAESEI